MNKKTLLKFCESGGSERWGTNHPWSFGDYTYATNGHVLIKIPRMSDIPENPKAPDVEAMDLQTPLKWYPIKDIKMPKPEKCDTCDGKGKAFQCIECEGRGIVYLSNTYNDYEADCKSCEGTRKVDVCDECNGTGETTPIIPMDFKGYKFNRGYLALISQLPNCEFGPTKPGKMSLFRFNGGTGMIMPIRNG